VNLDLHRMAADDAELPGLQEFAQAHGLDDFSESEQIAAYEVAHGSASARQRRRGRLIERQLDALRWLESLVAQPPRAGDSVVCWFELALAQHLEAAGLVTLARLVERINGVGRR
jgi:alkylhydroperoxidase family enzyme